MPTCTSNDRAGRGITSKRAEAPAKWLPGSGEQGAYTLHIIDPRGNLIMTYPADVAAKNVRGDLERLLKFAWTG